MIPGFRRAWQGAIGLLVAVIVVGSLAPARLAPELMGLDKLNHAAAYFALTALGAGIAETSLWRVAVRAFLLGLVLEGTQALWTADRAADWMDLLANAAGILAAWLMLRASRGAGWARQVEDWWSRRHGP